MDRDTAVSQIQEKLGFRTDLQPNIISALQFQQDELEKGDTLPWWLLQEDQLFTITPPNPPVATPQEYPLPPNFIKESDYQDGNLRYYQSLPGPAVYLKKMDMKQAEQFFFGPRRTWWQGQYVIISPEDTNFLPGTPVAYVLRKATVRIYPGPDKVYPLTWSYYTHDLVVSGGNVTNGWLANAPQLLIGLAGKQIAMTIRNADATALFNIILHGNPQGLILPTTSGAVKAFQALLYEREVAGRSFHMGARL